jgi:hypothetical protein
MRVTVDDVDLYTMSDIQKKVIQNDISADKFENVMMGQIQGILKNQYALSFKNLKQKWDPILATRMASVPTDPDAYAQLVFSQADYLDRKARDAAAAALQPK